MQHNLTLPIDHATARTLRIGDVLFLNGTVFTARDQAHALMLSLQASGQTMPFDPSLMALFHCGPVVSKQADGWKIVAAGPTTSIRMESMEDQFLEAFRPPIIIGKGGMGDRTSAALEAVGSVYVQYTGGAGALAAQRIESVENVEWLDDLSMTEAVWLLRVRKFGPLLVTMDSANGNLYKDLDRTIAENVKATIARIDIE
jgi:tartrate/fumarate subfamily iron-sulfur-dependent hydro-lyase beta chain